MTTMTYAGQQSTGFGGLGYGQEQLGLPQQVQPGAFAPWASGQPGTFAPFGTAPFGGVSPLYGQQFGGQPQYPQQQQQYFPQQYGPQQYGPQQQIAQISPWVALIVLATHLQQTLPQQGTGYGQIPQFSPYGQGQQFGRPWQMGY
jgi:hypothetical protein